MGVTELATAIVVILFVGIIWFGLHVRKRTVARAEEFEGKVREYAKVVDQQITETEELVSSMEAKVSAMERRVEMVMTETGWIAGDEESDTLRDELDELDAQLEGYAEIGELPGGLEVWTTCRSCGTAYTLKPGQPAVCTACGKV